MTTIFSFILSVQPQLFSEVEVKLCLISELEGLTTIQMLIYIFFLFLLSILKAYFYLRRRARETEIEYE